MASLQGPAQGLSRAMTVLVSPSWMKDDPLPGTGTRWPTAMVS
jgi:hypothetical protein